MVTFPVIAGLAPFDLPAPLVDELGGSLERLRKRAHVGALLHAHGDPERHVLRELDAQIEAEDGPQLAAPAEDPGAASKTSEAH
jgi:hypothetical protein